MATTKPIADTLREARLSGAEMVEIELTQPKPDEPMLPDAADSDWVIRRPKRANISAEESIRRTEDFINNPDRRERFIAAIRKSKG